MRMKVCIALALVFVTVLAVSQIGSEVDAEDGDVWYCYSHEMSFYYQGGTTDYDSIAWEVYGLIDGEKVRLSTTDGDESIGMIYLDRDEVSRCSEIYITQTVTKGATTVSETNTYIPVTHLDREEGILFVVFHDGYTDTPVGVSTITATTVVPAGGSFVQVPETPVREGHSFLGWFTEDGERFDPSEPVTGNVEVYAGWMTVTDGMTVVDAGDHIVTFVTSDGFLPEVISLGNGELVFTFNVLDGYAYDIDTLEVVATVGHLVMDDQGVFTLSDIDSDSVVTVTADRLYRIVIDASHVDVQAPVQSGWTAQGPFDAKLVVEDGYELSSVSVYMGSEDVTSQYLDGDTISIGKLTGDLRIVAHAEPSDDGGFPWIYLVIALVVIILILAAVAWRRRSDTA